MKRNQWVLFMTCSVFIASGCQSGKDDVPTPASTLRSASTIIYERQGTSAVNKSMFADHIRRIESIPPDDQLIERYRSHADWRRFGWRTSDMNGPVRKYTFDNSAVSVIEIPLKTRKQGESILIYTTSDTSLFIRGTMERLENSNTKFIYQSIDKDLVYYQFEVNEENKIGNFSVSAEIPFKTLWKSQAQKFQSATCQEQFANNWNKCMGCAYAECYSDWLCGLSCSLGTGIALGCASVFALHCANIGNPS